MSHQGEVFTGGASTSQHVDAEDDDHFQNTTFKLKRTRSLGLLDEFIDTDTQEKQIEKKNEEKRLEKLDTSTNDNLMQNNQHSLTTAPSSADSSASEVAASSPLDANSPFLKSPDIIPHDDSNLAPEPSRHVDYLSHQWDVTDISKSWRYIILRRKNVANAARLENASWRTWAQRRCNLKTINPEEVNWSKESDVTWLYGPIVDDDDHDHEHEHDNDPEDSENSSLLGSRSFNTASSVVAGDISIARKTHRRPKPILKKRTMQDMLISHLNLLKLEVATARAEQESRRREDAAAQARKDAAQSAERPPEYFDYDVILAKLNSQYKNYSQSNSRASSANNSSVDLTRKNNMAVSADAVASALNDVSSMPKLSQSVPTTRDAAADRSVEVQPIKEEQPPKRHVRFNEEVQQCIAIDDSSDYDDGYDDYEGSDYDYDGSESYLYESGPTGSERDHYDGDRDDDDIEEDEDEDDEDDEGGFFLNVRSSSKTMPENSFPGLASNKKAIDFPRLEGSNEEDKDMFEDDDDAASILSLRTIHMLPPTTLNYGSSNEESDDYTSSISHNIDNNSSRGYDYYYDYNSVYEVNPNHAIYGTSNQNRAPDVVDVPENISLGSNFDYEIIENEDVNNYGDALPEVYGQDGLKAEDSINSERDLRALERIPISSLDDSANYTTSSKSSPGSNVGSGSGSFNCNAFHSESESDSDTEGGLSISARNSSQSLAQQAFGQPLTEINPASLHFPAELYPEFHEPQPKHISSINPRYSSTSLSKQPHSSGSLADQFFGGTMTLTKSNSELSDMFLNISKSHDNSDQYQSYDQQNYPSDNQNTHGGSALANTSALVPYTATSSPPMQRKASPLPPTTTAANIFLGSRTPTPKPQQQKSLFMFDSEDDSEPEFVEDTSMDSSAPGDRNASSFASLYKVAGRTGIPRPSSESEDAKKGSAVSNFLGGWNKNHGA